MVTCFSPKIRYYSINFVRNIKVPGAIRCQEGSVPSAVFVSEGVAREITSPNYPEDNYENGHDCYWHIQAPQGLRIRADVIDLEVRNARLNWTKLFFTRTLFFSLSTADTVTMSNSMTAIQMKMESWPTTTSALLLLMLCLQVLTWLSGLEQMAVSPTGASGSA